MSLSSRIPRISIDRQLPGAVDGILTDFYREEFLKHRQCLERHREFYSERAIAEVEIALNRTIARLEHLCRKEDADEVVSRLLRRFDVVTGLSAWSDPRNVH